MGEQENARSPKPNGGIGSLLWHSIKSGAYKYGFGLAAKEVAKRIVPTALTIEGIHGVQLLQPMGRLATGAKQVAEGAGRWGTSVSPLLPIALVALNPTNRFPGSSAERGMVRRGMEEQRRLEVARQRNDELLRQIAQQRLYAESQQRQQAEARQRQQVSERAAAERTQRQAQSIREAQQRTLQLQMRTPSPWNSPAMAATRLEPMRLRPPPKIQTPFNLRLMRPSPAGNPFGLSVMGRPIGTPFGLSLGTRQLRAPMIGR